MDAAEVDAMVAAYAADCGHLATPEGARGRCYAASVAFLYDLYAAALTDLPSDEAEVVQVWDHAPTPHFIIRVGERTFDFTARQFDPDAAFPVVATVADYVTTPPERRARVR